MVYVWKFLAAVVFSAVSLFVLAIWPELIPVGEAIGIAMTVAAVAAISVICIRAPSGRQAWSGCSRLVGGGMCLLSLAIPAYAIGLLVVGELKVESWEFKDYFAHILLMLIGVHFLAAVAGFVVGACLFGLGQALKTSAPRETRIDAEGP